MDSLREWMNYPGNTLQNKKANFGSDGDYIEYVGYFMYAFSNYCIFNEMLKKDDRLDALDFSESEEKTADFYSSFFHRLWDGPRLADFGDISLQVEKHSQYIFYLCGKFNKSWTQENFKQLNARLALPYEFYFYNPDIASSGWLPPREKIFHDSGYAIIRSGFTADDTSFMMKTGESWNHNHDDAGTFELACRGQLFITDSGNCSYGDPNYVQYYIKPQAHNVIHFNGGQEPDDIRYHGTKYMGNFPAFLSTETYKYLLADCAGPFINQFQRYYRHVIFIKDMIVMIDDLFTYEEGNLHYNLHVNGKVELDANLAVLTSHGVQLEIHSLFPRNKEWQLQSGYAHEIKNGGSAAPVQPEVEYLQISTPTEKRREKFIHCFKLPSGSASEVRVTADEGEWAKEVVIEREDGTERIICNMRADGRVMHQNSSLTYKNIETDAFIIYIKSSHDGKILQVAQHNGSLLKIDGICYISSMLKNDSLLNLEDGSITVHNTSDASCYFKTSPDNQAQPGKFKLKAGTSTLKI
ncbi:heparinase II/III family protein [Paenibacillus sepulcri]